MSHPSTTLLIQWTDWLRAQAAHPSDILGPQLVALANWLEQYDACVDRLRTAISERDQWIAEHVEPPAPAECADSAAFTRLREQNERLLIALQKARRHLDADLQALVETETNPVTGLIDSPEALLTIEAEQDLLNQVIAAIEQAQGAPPA